MLHYNHSFKRGTAFLPVLTPAAVKVAPVMPLARIADPQQRLQAPPLSSTLSASTAQWQARSGPSDLWFAAAGLACGVLGFAAAVFRRGSNVLSNTYPEVVTLLPLAGVTVQQEDVEDEIFTFENLRSAPGSRPRKHRKGRGHSAGQGMTCGFGNKGQKARKGRPSRPGFEGGQNPLWRRSPKLRGRSLGPGHKRIEYQMVSLLKLVDAAPGSTVQFDDRSGAKPVLFKVGGLKATETAAVPANLTVKAHGFTATARAAIEAAGGKCVTIDKYSREVVPEEKGKAKGKAEKVVAMVAFTGKVVYYNEEQPAVDSDPDWVDVDDDAEEGVDAAAPFAFPEGGEPIAMFAATAAPVRRVKVGTYKVPAPRSSKMSEKKKAIIDQVNQSLRSSFLVFGFSTKGYTHAQLSKLRRAVPAGVKIQVVKNTLFRNASRGTGFEVLDPLTTDSKAWVFVPEDSFQQTVKSVAAFLKETKKQETNPILGGALPNSLLTETQVLALSDMPSKKELIATVARLIKLVPTRVATVVKATPKKLAVAIRLATTKGAEEGNEASPPA